MLLLRVTLLLLICCSYAAAAPAACESSKVVTNGELCTIVASDTYPGMQDAGATVNGFGRHVIALPTTSNNKLWLHFGGTGATPYIENIDRYLNVVWLGELMGQGYTVIDLAYDSEVSVTESCMGAGVNDCAGKIREEVMFGTDTTTMREVSTVNSIQHRLKALIDYTKKNNFPMPKGTYPFKGWRNMGVSGHSQGAGYAYWISKFHGAKFGCFLGGPYDIPDNTPTPTPVADWYILPKNVTAINQMGGFLTVDDDFYTQFTYVLNYIGLVKNTHWFDVDKAVYRDHTGATINGHAAAVQDPSLSAERAAACFR